MDLHRHQEVLSAIRGKTVEIPDFFSILDRWPRKVNPNYSAVILTADQTIERQVLFLDKAGNFTYSRNIVFSRISKKLRNLKVQT